MRSYALHSLDARNRNIECPGNAGFVNPSGGQYCPVPPVSQLRLSNKAA